MDVGFEWEGGSGKQRDGYAVYTIAGKRSEAIWFLEWSSAKAIHDLLQAAHVDGQRRVSAEIGEAVHDLCLQIDSRVPPNAY